MNIKQFLNQAFHLNGLIESNKLELEKLRELAASVPAPDLSKERVQTSGTVDRIGNTVALIVDLEAEIQADINRYVKVKKDIRRVINAVTDQKLKLVLQERYLNFKKWEQIAVDMNYTMRRITQLHGEALELLTKKNNDGENISFYFTVDV